MKFSFQGPRAVKRRASVQGLRRVQLWHSSLATRLQKRSISWSASTGRSSQDISISRPIQKSSAWSHSRWWCSKWSQWWQGPNLHQYLQLLWVCRLSLLSIPSAGLPGRQRGGLTIMSDIFWSATIFWPFDLKTAENTIRHFSHRVAGLPWKL